jgi:hypothetical protein
MYGLPLVVTLAYALWCDNKSLAFIGGFIYPWAFPTLLLIWNYSYGGTILYLPPEGFAFFGGIGLAYGLIGFITSRVFLKL